MTDAGRLRKRASNRRYEQTPKRKAARRALEKTPKRRAYHTEWNSAYRIRMAHEIKLCKVLGIRMAEARELVRQESMS